MLRHLLPVVLLLCARAASGETPSPGTATHAPVSIEVEFYFQPGCDECRRVREKVLPELHASYSEFIRLRETDVSIPDNHRRLVAVMQRLGVVQNARVYMLVDDRVLLAGADRIAAGLLPAVEARLADLALGPGPDGVAEAAAPDTAQDPDLTGLQSLAKEFRLLAVTLAGLTDGINPCAIATLVFLVSVLGLSGRAGSGLVAVGSVFCLATFLTYTAIGLGLMSALHRLAAFRRAQAVADVVLVALLVLLAVLSFADAFRFRRTGRAEDVRLQLPGRVKNVIHRLLRTRVGRGRGLASVFVAGVAVTALESVCTGQLYLPTLAALVRSGVDPVRNLLFLLAYNAAFVVPLVVVIVLVQRGMKLSRLVQWSVREVFVGKLLMGVLFTVMAVVVAAMAMKAGAG